MTDNERIDQLVAGLVSVINGSQLPLGVKALALENMLFRVKDAMRCQEAASNSQNGGDVHDQSYQRSAASGECCEADSASCN